MQATIRTAPRDCTGRRRQSATVTRKGSNRLAEPPGVNVKRKACIAGSVSLAAALLLGPAPPVSAAGSPADHPVQHGTDHPRLSDRSDKPTFAMIQGNLRT